MKEQSWAWHNMIAKEHQLIVFVLLLEALNVITVMDDVVLLPDLLLRMKTFILLGDRSVDQ